MPTSDFGAKCEAEFLGYCAQLAAINLSEPTKRKVNAHKRAEILVDVDDLLDVYNKWKPLAALDREFTSADA